MWFTCVTDLIPGLLPSLPAGGWFEFSATRFRDVVQPGRLEPLQALLRRVPVGAPTHRKLALVFTGLKGEPPVVSVHNPAVMPD